MALDLARRLLAYRFNMSYVPVPVVQVRMTNEILRRDRKWKE